MKPSDIMIQIGRPVAYYTGFARLWGPAAGVFFSQLFYWTGKQIDKDGWIYKTQEEIEDEIGLSADSQQTARNRLKAAGVLEERYNRIEHRLYYRVVLDKLNELFDGGAIGEPPIRESENPRLDNRRTSDSLNRNLTENTAENTETPGTKKAPVPGTPINDKQIVVRVFDPDEENKPIRKKAKCKKTTDAKLFPWAEEISILCCMPLGSGADGELFRAAKLLVNGKYPPRQPSDLRPIFAKGGKFFAEWPSRVLHPMDIPKNWPRLSGAVKPPEARPSHESQMTQVDGTVAANVREAKRKSREEA